MEGETRKRSQLDEARMRDDPIQEKWTRLLTEGYTFLEEQLARKNRTYSPEFKREALTMLAMGAYTMAKLERE